MSFSYKLMNFRSGNTYDSSKQLELSVHKEVVTGEVDVHANGGNKENSVWFSPNLNEERIKSSLEPLHAQISALTELLDCLNRGNSTRDFTTAGTRELRQQSE